MSGFPSPARIQAAVDAMLDPALARRLYADPVMRARVIEVAEAARVSLLDAAAQIEARRGLAGWSADQDEYGIYLCQEAARQLVLFKSWLVA